MEGTASLVADWWSPPYCRQDHRCLHLGPRAASRGQKGFSCLSSPLFPARISSTTSLMTPECPHAIICSQQSSRAISLRGVLFSQDSLEHHLSAGVFFEVTELSRDLQCPWCCFCWARPPFAGPCCCLVGDGSASSAQGSRVLCSETAFLGPHSLVSVCREMQTEKCRLEKCLLQSAHNLQGLYSAWSQVLSVLLEVEGELMGSKAQPSSPLPQQPAGLAPRTAQSGKGRGVCPAIQDQGRAGYQIQLS